MPTRDHHWRAQVIGGVATICVACLIVVVLIFTLLNNSLRNYLFGPHLRALAPLILATNCIFVGYLTTQGVALWRAGLCTRTRYRMRVGAMNGQPGAMPLVRCDIACGIPADAPDGLDLTLMLTWRATNSAYRVEIPVFGFFAAVFLAFLGFPVYLVSLIENAAPAHTIPLIWTLFLYSVIFVVVAGCLSAAWLFIRHLFALPRQRGVVATEEGITYYPRYMAPQRLPWEDMWLLELAMPERNQSSSPATYILHAMDGAAEWSERLRNTSFVNFGAPNDELARRQQALLDLIAARTGLQPRSCNRELWEVAGGDAQAMSEDEEDEESDDEGPDDEPDDDEPDDEGPDDEGASSAQHIVLLVMGVMSALVVLPSAAAIVLVGLTTSSALNALTAVSLLVAYGITVYAATRPNRPRTPSEAAAGDEAADEASPSAEAAVAVAAPEQQDDQQGDVMEADAMYGLVFGATTHTQLGFSAVGLALTLCALPGLSAAIGDQARRYTPGSVLATLPAVQGTGAHGELAFLGTAILFALGFIGALFVVASLPFSRTLIVADADGMRWRRRRQTRRLAWREIASVEAQMNDGQLDIYAATNSGASVTITWYADAYTVRPLTPRDLRRIGAPTQPIQPIMPRALAALVQERSGVALTYGEMTASGFSGRRE